MGFTIKNGYKRIVIENILDYLMDLKGNYIINIHGILKDTDEFSIIKNYMDKAQRNYIEPSLKCYFLELNSKDYNDYVLLDLVAVVFVPCNVRKEDWQGLGTIL